MFAGAEAPDTAGADQALVLRFPNAKVLETRMAISLRDMENSLYTGDGMMIDDVRQYRAIAVTIVTGKQKKSRLASGKDWLRTVREDRMGTKLCVRYEKNAGIRLTRAS